MIDFARIIGGTLPNRNRPIDGLDQAPGLLG
jgi:hypothetical protein